MHKLGLEWECQNKVCKIKCKDKLVCQGTLEGKCRNDVRIRKLQSDNTVFNLNCQLDKECGSLVMDSTQFNHCLKEVSTPLPFTCEPGTTKNTDTTKDTVTNNKRSWNNHRSWNNKTS